MVLPSLEYRLITSFGGILAQSFYTEAVWGAGNKPGE